MNLDVFFVVVSILFVLLLIAAIVLWFIESKMDYERKKKVAEKINSGEGMRLEHDDLLLQVTDGKVKILQELPTEEASCAEPAAAEAEEDAFDLEPLEDDSDEDEPADRVDLTENSVVFESTGKENKSFADKYAALDEDSRRRYDAVSEYILAQSDCKKRPSSTAETFKCKTDKIMRAVIRRDKVILNFMLPNTDLNRFVKQEGIKDIKINPVVIRLEDDLDLALAKQTTDIAIAHAREEQQYRKESRKEQRRKAREAQGSEQKSETGEE